MQKAQRQTNFELLRLVSMFLIVMGHSIMHGLRNITSTTIPDIGISPTCAVDMLNFSASQLLGYMSNVGVNLFILITGYFITKPKNFRSVAGKAFRLWRTMVFYCIIILIIDSLVAEQMPSLNDILVSVTPIYHNTYWFVTQYVALFLLSPFLARLLSVLDKREFNILLLVMFLLNFQQESLGYGGLYSGGMTLMFFIFLFCIGSYIHRFNPIEKVQSYGWLLYLCICIGMTLLGVFLQFRHLGIVGHEYLYVKGLANNSLPLFSSVALFLWFKTIYIGSQRLCRIILRFSPCVFGVYLIHDNSMVRNLLWSHVKDYIHDPWFIAGLIAYVIVVFVVCLLIDILREFFVGLVHKR